MITRRPRSFVLVASLVLAACGGGSANRADVVAETTAQVVPDHWAQFARAADELEAVTGAACEDDEAPESIGVAVTSARALWTGLNPWWFGPVMDERSRFVVDFDVDPVEIDALLASAESLDATTLRDLYGADQRGLGAIDAVLASTVELNERQCEFLVANAGLVRAEAATLAASWEQFGVDAAADDAAANATIEAMVNEVLFALAALADEADPAVTASTLQGIRFALVGAPDPNDGPTGIAALLDDAVAEQLGVELDAAIADPTSESIMAVEITVTTNVVSTLGLSVQFSDADGDG
ncbi:MAG: imelysin family protein [Actinomycetota bacterium]